MKRPLPPGWHREANFTPWSGVSVLGGCRPFPDAIGGVPADEDSDGITSSYGGLIYVVAPDDEVAFKLAADITAGLVGPVLTDEAFAAAMKAYDGRGYEGENWADAGSLRAAIVAALETLRETP